MAAWFWGGAANPEEVAARRVRATLEKHGWHLRSGIKYGADFVTYDRGPGPGEEWVHEGHGRFLVKVVDDSFWARRMGPPSDHQSLRGAPGASWRWLVGRVRLTSTVSKELIVAHHSPSASEPVLSLVFKSWSAAPPEEEERGDP